jgi:hypothetical protein
MAGAERNTAMSAAKAARAKLISVDGIDAAAVLATAKTALAAATSGAPGMRGGISRWDASGIFQDLAVADDDAGTPSPRTLLLLYAADLAFRLRWQVRPALTEGRTVVVAPYVDTAIAFGRAAGLPANWLENLFRFAPRAAERHLASTRDAVAGSGKDGFVAFACRRISADGGRACQRLIKQTAGYLDRGSRRTHPRR